ncbi:MAG: DUF1697 domain-containing protein [Porphyromonadaceae bacterium]|nr:DUF1697 domain-containing protein [Porphyromonadaceae bacterium]
MIYLALFRGINVGGHNIVEMRKLKTTFESLGFGHVSTFINSGNVVFEDSLKKEDELIQLIEEAVKKDFQLDVKVIVINSEKLNTICQELPATWVKNESMRTDVMFLWEKYDRPEVLKEMPINSVDNVKYVPGAVLWNVEGKNYSRSGMIKLVGTDLYRHMTIRNVNTVRKLHQIISEKR